MADAKASKALEILQQYYNALNRFDPEGAAAFFTEDAKYSHPPYPAGTAEDFPTGPGGRVEVQGREVIARLLRARGELKMSHQMLTSASDGTLCFVLARAEMGDNVNQFLVTVELDDDTNLLTSFTAYR